MCKITSSGWFGRARSQVMDGLDYSLLWLTIHNLKFCPKFRKTEKLGSVKTTEWNWRKSPNGIEKKKNGPGSAQCDVEDHHQDKAKTETDGSVVAVRFRGGFGN